MRFFLIQLEYNVYTYDRLLFHEEIVLLADWQVSGCLRSAIGAHASPIIND